MCKIQDVLKDFATSSPTQPPKQSDSHIPTRRTNAHQGKDPTTSNTSTSRSHLTNDRTQITTATTVTSSLTCNTSTSTVTYRIHTSSQASTSSSIASPYVPFSLSSSSNPAPSTNHTNPIPLPAKHGSSGLPSPTIYIEQPMPFIHAKPITHPSPLSDIPTILTTAPDHSNKPQALERTPLHPSSDSNPASTIPPPFPNNTSQSPCPTSPTTRPFLQLGMDSSLEMPDDRGIMDLNSNLHFCYPPSPSNSSPSNPSSSWLLDTFPRLSPSPEPQSLSPSL